MTAQELITRIRAKKGNATQGEALALCSIIEQLLQNAKAWERALSDTTKKLGKIKS